MLTFSTQTTKTALSLHVILMRVTRLHSRREKQSTAEITAGGRNISGARNKRLKRERNSFRRDATNAQKDITRRRTQVISKWPLNYMHT